MSEHASRRRFLQATLTLIPAVTLAPQDVFSATPENRKISIAKPAARNSNYVPRYFTEDEWQFIHVAVAQLIPADELGPSAVECGIPEYIDRQMQTPYAHGALWFMQGPFVTGLGPELGYQQKYTPREIYRLGIEACNAWTKTRFGQPFDRLDQSNQIKVLEQLEAGHITLGEMSGSLFFAQLLGNTKEGYFADPIYGGNKDMTGWKMIGFPGARADYMDWIDHPNERYPLGPVSIDGNRS